jgi:hypothetical protein
MGESDTLPHHMRGPSPFIDPVGYSFSRADARSPRNRPISHALLLISRGHTLLPRD